MKTPETTSSSLATDIARLADLRQQGMLTEEEFHDAKKELLSQLASPAHKTQTAPNDIEQPSTDGSKSNSKYLIIGILALFSLAISAFVLFGRTTKTQTETIDLGQLVELFMVVEGEQASWSMGAGEAGQQIKWQSQGVESDARRGFARVTVGKMELQNLRTRLEPVQWEINISTSGLPKFGPEIVEIAPKCDTVECSFDLEKALTTYGFKLKRLCHAGPASANATGFMATYSNKKIYILYSENSGSGGSSNSLTLSWAKPATGDEQCADAKKNESDATPMPAEQPKPTESALPNEQSSLSAPIINVGDKYTYETESTDSNGKITTSTSTREVTIIDGSRVTVTSTSGKTGKARTLIYDRSWNIIETGDTPNSGIVYKPAIQYFDFPMAVGKKWKSNSEETDKKTGKSRQYTINGEVIGATTIEVPAGRFETFKIKVDSEVMDGEKRSTGSDLSWYAPSIGRSVKSELSGRDAEGHQDSKIVVLLAYQTSNLNNPPVKDFGVTTSPNIFQRKPLFMATTDPSGNGVCKKIGSDNSLSQEFERVLKDKDFKVIHKLQTDPESGASGFSVSIQTGDDSFSFMSLSDSEEQCKNMALRISNRTSRQ